MPKAFHYIILLIGLIIFTGCNTIRGASAGAQQDMSDTWKNAKNADAWMRQNMW